MAELPLAVLYLRMSTDQQETSIPQQREKVIPWAKGKYHIVAEYIDEGKSGSKNTEKRVDFLRMIHDLTLGKFSKGKEKVRYVLCVDMSRFGRLDTLTGAEHKLKLKEAGVKLATPMDGVVDWSTSMGRIIDTVKSEGNHAHSTMIAEKGLQGRIRATKEGKPNQVTPYGMAKKVTSPSGKEEIVPRTQKFLTPKGWTSKFCPGDATEVEAIRFMFETYLNQDINFTQLAVLMNKRGFPHPTAHQRKDIAWQGDTIQWMLQNPIYCGAIRIGVQPKGKFFRVSNEKETPANEIDTTPEPITTWDAHEGIISREMFNEVHEKIKKNFKQRRAPRNHGPYALVGIIACGNCGCFMYGSKNDKGEITYRCHRNEKNPIAGCGYWMAYESRVMPFLLKNFFPQIKEQIIRETARREVMPMSDDRTKEIEKKIKAKQEQVANAKRNFLNAPPEISKGMPEMIGEMEAELHTLEASLTEIIDSGISPLQKWWERYVKEFFEGNPIELPGTKTFTPTKRGQRVEIKDEIYVDGQADPSLRSLGSTRGYGDGSGNIATIKYADQVFEKIADGEMTVVQLAVPASVLRERFKRIGLKISVWFKRKKKGKGYDMDKMRVQAYINGEVCYEYAGKDAS